MTSLRSVACQQHYAASDDASLRSPSIQRLGRARSCACGPARVSTRLGLTPYACIGNPSWELTLARGLGFVKTVGFRQNPSGFVEVRTYANNCLGRLSTRVSDPG